MNVFASKSKRFLTEYRFCLLFAALFAIKAVFPKLGFLSFFGSLKFAVSLLLAAVFGIAEGLFVKKAGEKNRKYAIEISSFFLLAWFAFYNSELIVLLNEKMIFSSSLAFAAVAFALSEKSFVFSLPLVIFSAILSPEITMLFIHVLVSLGVVHLIKKNDAEKPKKRYPVKKKPDKSFKAKVSAFGLKINPAFTSVLLLLCFVLCLALYKRQYNGISFLIHKPASELFGQFGKNMAYAIVFIAVAVLFTVCLVKSNRKFIVPAVALAVDIAVIFSLYFILPYTAFSFYAYICVLFIAAFAMVAYASEQDSEFYEIYGRFSKKYGFAVILLIIIGIGTGNNFLG